MHKCKETVNESDRLISCDYLHLSFRQSHVYLRKYVNVVNAGVNEKSDREMV